MKNKRYFKQAPHVLLSEAEKLKTLEVIERGLDHLKSQRERWNYETDNLLRDIDTVLYHNRRRNKYFAVTCNLIKGYTQSKAFNGPGRAWEIEILAKQISDESGADYEEVKELFLKIMDPYLHFTY